MSEIKGQLLGIILVLMVFGAVSVGLATVFKKTTDTVVEKANTITDGIDTALSTT